MKLAEKSDQKSVDPSIEFKPLEGKTSEISDLKARLQAKIAQLRQKRTSASQPKSRADLIDSRLKRQDEKQKRKKEAKAQQDSISRKRSAEHLDEEASTAVNSDIDAGDKGVKEDISFGNINFGLQEEEKKKKGPIDTLGQLKKARIRSLPNVI